MRRSIKDFEKKKKTIKKFVQLSRAELTQFPGGLFFWLDIEKAAFT
jgi:hypothetical protein